MSLLRHLNEQRSRLEALAHQFADEQQQLVSGHIDGDALQRIAGEKARLLQAIDASEASRRHVQHRLGYSDDAKGALQAARDAGCEETWRSLLDLTADIARLNQRHGHLIDLRMQHNRRMLDFLHGLTEKRVYSSRGQREASPGRLNTSA